MLDRAALALCVAAACHFDAPYELADIVANGEARWEFHHP
jgi:hypothetical protein